MIDGKILKIASLGLPLVAVIALLTLGVMLPPQKADASPAIAQQTGKGCPACHTKAPALNSAGKKYKKTGKI